MEIGGIGKATTAAFTVVFLVAGLLETAAADRQSGIWKILQAGRFSGAMNQEAQVEPLGDLLANGKLYRLMEFSWEQTRQTKRWGALHAQYRLLVFENGKKGIIYLGSYVTGGEVRPYIKGPKVIYPYKDLAANLSRDISFEHGPPPVIYLGGDESHFSR